MQYKTLPGIGKPFSRLTYGTPGPAFSGDKERAFRIYDLAWEAGFRTFDTAHSYGHGEEVLGEWLESRRLREEAVILDKGLNPGQFGCDDIYSRQTVRSQAEESLRRLKTDHVELYILHRDDAFQPVDGIVEELNALKREGKILFFGASNWTHERIRAFDSYAASHGLDGFSCFSPAYSLAEYVHDPWGRSVSLTGEARQPYREYLAESRLPVFCYSSLGRGYLSGKFRTDGGKPIGECIAPAPIWEYDCPLNRGRLTRAERLAAQKGATVPQICLAWLLAQPILLFPIVTPTSREHIAENVAALDVSLTPDECRYLLSGEPLCPDA